MDQLGEVDYAAIAGYLALPLVALHSIPAIRSILQRATHSYKPISQADYSDEDGEATPESLRGFSDKWERSAILFFSEAGLLVSLALSVLETLNGNDILIWLQFGVWILLIIQAIAFITEPRSTVRYDLGNYAFWASWFASSIPITELVLVVFSDRTYYSNIRILLQIVQAGCAVLRALFTVLLPRSPELFHKGRPVDPERLVSMLNRFTFSYSLSFMQRVYKIEKINLNHLPQLAASLRVSSLLKPIENNLKGRTVLKALAITHYWPLILQTILTLIHCLLTLGTQAAFFQLLKHLEQRGSPHFDRIVCHTLNLAMTVMSISGVNLESATNWLSCTRLGLPAAAELRAIAYAKAMRQKDANFEIETTSSSKGKVRRKNLMSILDSDIKSVSHLADFNWSVFQAIAKLTLGAGFLVQILGWQSAFAGFLAPFVMLPLNMFVTGKLGVSRREWTVARDITMAAVTELFKKIEGIKLLGFELRQKQKAENQREKELLAAWKRNLVLVALTAVTQFSPTGMSAISLTTYALLYGDLPVSIAFTSLTVFKSLEYTFSQIPSAISCVSNGRISGDIIDMFFDMPDKIRNTIPGDQIAYEDAFVSWPTRKDSASVFTLRNLNFKLPKGALTVISGGTGSGKSLLLKSFLSEAEVVGGTLRVPVPPSEDERYDKRANEANWILDSAHALVAETPWNENTSIKDNILFGLPECEKRLDQVIFACALTKDLESFKHGILTDVAPDGKNLSGGQKWRVALARALYSRAGIIFMEDILSALDARTARHIFEHALTGDLAKGRTRVLVTHNVDLCWPRTDYFLKLGDRSIEKQGAVDRPQESNHPQDISNLDIAANSDTIDENGDVNDEEEEEEDPAPEFVLEEKRNSGSVKRKYYQAYFEAGGSWPFWIMVVSTYLSYTGVELGRTWWLKTWAEAAKNINTDQVHHSLLSQTTMQPTVPANPDYNLMKYLGIYIGFSLGIYLLVIGRTFVLLLGTYRASRAMFNKMTARLIRTKKEWMDATPTPRILTRYSSDFSTLDSEIGSTLGMFFDLLLQVAAVMVAGILVHWSGILMCLALLAVCWKISRFYLPSIRGTSTLKNTAKSRLNTHIRSSIEGRLTIGTFGREHAYIEKMQDLGNDVTRTDWSWWICNRWLANSMGSLGCVFSSTVAALAIESQGIPVAKAAVALSYTSRFWSPVVGVLRQYANVQSKMNAVERVVEYSQLVCTEPEGGVRAPAAWPTEGRIEVRNLEVYYPKPTNDTEGDETEESHTEVLSPALKDVSFTVESNERIGIVGRTGAGKSTLALAFFRFLEASSGKILIDGVDISKMNLHDLRSRLGVVSQYPPLVAGTVRDNLEMAGTGFTDEELYDVLARVNPERGRSTSATTQEEEEPTPFTSLSYKISANGKNVSKGQRQLLCLARALLARSKVMILDEATSDVDMKTDALVQQAIRQEFGRNFSTLLVIAHRLTTIADFDRVLVIDEGRVAEMGSPKELMEKNGIFKDLVENSDKKEVVENIIFKGESYVDQSI